MIFPCLNFPSSFLMGKSNQNKQSQQISSFCLISFFFKFSTNKILRFVFPNIKQTLIFKVCRTHQKRRGKIQTGENRVRQGLSKVFVFFNYSRPLKSVPSFLSLFSFKNCTATIHKNPSGSFL